MRRYFLVSLFIVVLIIYYSWEKMIRIDATYVKSPHDNHEYLVRNTHDKTKAAYMLSKIRENLLRLKIYLMENIDMFEEYKPYILRLNQKLNSGPEGVIFSESSNNSRYTSYTIAKGEEIVMCLRCKKTNDIHTMNVLMYVAIHEISHIACPEKNHTPLFMKIFKFFLEKSVELKIWKYENYIENPCEYCGTTISENLL